MYERKIKAKSLILCNNSYEKELEVIFEKIAESAENCSKCN